MISFLTSNSTEGSSLLLKYWYKTNKYYINIEICYSKGTTRERQMDSYVYSIFFKEAIKSDKLQNMKKN